VSNTHKWTEHNARRGGPAAATRAPQRDQPRPVRRRTRTANTAPATHAPAAPRIAALEPHELAPHALGDTVTIKLLEGVVGLGNAGDVLRVTETTAIELVETRGYAIPWTVSGGTTATPLYQTLTSGPMTLSAAERAAVLAYLGITNGINTGADVVAALQPGGSVLYSGSGVSVPPNGGVLLNGSNVTVQPSGNLLVA
jgi:hypothetical protein